MTVQVGILRVRLDPDPGALRRLLARAADAGVDHVKALLRSAP